MTTLTASGPYTPSEKRAITRALNIISEKQPCFEDLKELGSPVAAAQYCALQLADGTRERFLCLFMNTQHSLISGEILFEGTINEGTVYPREIVRRALELNAAVIIVAHNHPSGRPDPSQADIRITELIRSALSLVDIRLLDHIIVGNGGGLPTASLSERGLM